MMNEIGFEDLTLIYDETDFGADGDATIKISSEKILALLGVIDASQKAAEDTQIAVVDEIGDLSVGSVANARVAEPRISIGVLAKDFDSLLLSPSARTKEPNNYYIISGRITRGRKYFLLPKYRAAISLVSTLAEAAAFFDGTKQELVYFSDGRFDVPVIYTADDLGSVDEKAVTELLNLLAGTVHGDQKKEILSTAIIDLTAALPARERFRFILKNISEVKAATENGYKLFVSNFSYRKIRDEIEEKKAEYISRIHKTFVDIQSQLLAIPVATIVVASQLRSATECGIESWTNVAVMAGTWVFSLLLMIAVVNQWVTLTAVGSDVKRQKGRLRTEFPAVEGQFVDVFDGLLTRVSWHKFGLVVIALIAIGGGVLTSIVYHRVTDVAASLCF